jgi:hypothetical protein
MKKVLSLLILASILSSSIKAGNTFKNILKHSNIGAPVAAATIGAVYRLTGDADLASTGASSLALAAMQIKEECSNNKDSSEKIVSVIKEGFKPWVGHLMATTGIAAARGALSYLNVPGYLIPDAKISPRVANFLILTYVGFMKATGQLIEK